MPTVAHLILAYKSPEQVSRLVKSLQHPNGDIFIHIDKKADKRPFLFLSKIANVYFIQQRFVITWGGYSITECYISGMKEILAHGKYDHVVLMSGQDYPLKSMEEFHKFLDDNRGLSFMSVEKQEEDSKWWFYAKERYSFYHLHETRLFGKKFFHKLSKRIFPRREFIFPGYELYGGPGATFCALTAEAATYIVNFMRDNRKAYRFAKYTHASDEFWFQTLLMNSPLKVKVVNKPLWYICWKGTSKHPRVLSVIDYNVMMSSGMFFGRKFDMHADETVMTMLDNHLSERKSRRTLLVE